ncbi:hypothetical protein GUITHDRAFT_98961 [Guillardia theta CCMP2712]|uniref:NADP-dependent oxidoreductase domain-containing protein n=1 Tax=Guillardia theta (strain CCMP2712) TaxID=905079 RepID=L1K2X5_GUITC|nr:hypothetical protein GUITHDRAFT_98961 [Guillardia theta CCMP2712]EKX55181.1 hypothetical protein GUITHDRAFT_98961 [Guillardia theta CCMP2712]|eukprot:XP_005842161.1 hypothetical protein GUITHDRAFT_98961 [Guillardia theta CCMP2712]
MAIIRTAARLGAELFDTADSYGADDKDFGYVEKLLHEALRGGAEGRGGEEEQRGGRQERGGERREACVATKGGMLRVSREANGWRPSRCDREYLLTRMRSSWENLGGRDPVFLWQLHHPNEKESPIEEAMQAAKTAQERGWVRHVGLCNVTLDQLKRARRVVEVAAVQCELNYWTRKAEKQGILDYCRDNGIAFIAFGALGGLKHLASSFPALKYMADRKGFSCEATALASMRHLWPHLIHIPGARTEEHVQDIARGREVRFTAAELDELRRMKPSR